MPTIIISIVLGGLIALAIVKVYKNSKKGGCASCGGCSSSVECPHSHHEPN